MKPVTVINHFNVGADQTYLILVYAERADVVAAIRKYGNDPSVQEHDTLETYLESKFETVAYNYVEAETKGDEVTVVREE